MLQMWENNVLYNIPFNSTPHWISFAFHFPDGRTTIYTYLEENGWHHFVIVLPGSTWENKISLYHNGNKLEDPETYSRSLSRTIPSGSGKIVIEREYTDKDGYYRDTICDELIFWNRPLTDDEAKSIYQRYNSNGD